VTALHARIDVLEGELSKPLGGALDGLRKRAFGVLTLTRSDGTAGVGEASPLPGYSPDSLEEAADTLHGLVDDALSVDPLASPFEVLSSAFAAHPCSSPAARFALETALLDWLGHTRGTPLHQVVAGEVERNPIDIASLVSSPDATAWGGLVDVLVAEGASHIKFKVGTDFDREVSALVDIRQAHPEVALRVDGNRRIAQESLRRHAETLANLSLELFEEPVAPSGWNSVLELPLPFALDETLRDEPLAARLLATGKIRAVVLKPMVLGGFRACFQAAERAAEHGAEYLVSHTFDGPIARAAAAELALALQTRLAAGLGVHPALSLWPPSEAAAIRDRKIVPHGEPGLGLRFEEGDDA
jgi:L-alanine-DL-glutamate epimerase-like enolase superfamily enzyme